MTAVQTCALPGCSKPPFPSSDRASPHLACGNLHHLLLMAGRFNPDPALPHPHQHILDRNATGLCALPSCRKPPYPGHSWCSRTDYLQWLFDFTSSLHADQFCKLPGCTRHVFVNENNLPWQFCGWKHRQEHVMRSARQQCHDQQPPSQECLPSPPPENVCGHIPSVDSLMQSLRDYAISNAPNNIKVDYDFFDRHPWEVPTEGICVFIVRCKYTGKGKRVMVTKDNYHWKQQGRPSSKNSYILKYFTYRKLKGKEPNEAAEHHNASTYFMEEYTAEGIKDFSLIKLRKSSDGHGKHRKRRPVADGKQFCAEVNNDACSQNMTMPQSEEICVESSLCSQNMTMPQSDEISLESFFLELPPL